MGLVFFLALVVMIETGLLIGGYLYYQNIEVINQGSKAGINRVKNSDNQKFVNIKTTPTPVLSDKRSCIKGEVPDTFGEAYFSGKTFLNISMSGETGLLQSDQRLILNWGKDWAGPDDKRPNSGVGNWRLVKNGQSLSLFLERTSISDGSYTDFKYYQYNNEVFAVPKEFIGLIIGPSGDKNEKFFDDLVKMCL